MNPLNKRMIATPKLKGERYIALQEQIVNIKQTLLDLSLSEKSNYLLADIPNLKREPTYTFNDILSIVDYKLWAFVQLTLDSIHIR